MGLIGAAFGIGFILGPAIGDLLSTISYSTPAFFAAAVSMLSVITTLFFLKETVDIAKTAQQEKSAFSLKPLMEVLRAQPIGVLIISFLLINFAFSAMTATFALWTQGTFQYGPRETGWLFSFAGVISVITQLALLPKLVSHFGERKLLQGGVLLLGVGLFLLHFSTVAKMAYVSILFIAFGNGISKSNYSSTCFRNCVTRGIWRCFGFITIIGKYWQDRRPCRWWRNVSDLWKRQSICLLGCHDVGSICRVNKLA